MNHHPNCIAPAEGGPCSCGLDALQAERDALKEAATCECGDVFNKNFRGASVCVCGYCMSSIPCKPEHVVALTACREAMKGDV